MVYIDDAHVVCSVYRARTEPVQSVFMCIVERLTAHPAGENVSVPKTGSNAS
jgi:hypothetical protein